jgi:hypothetical protein
VPDCKKVCVPEKEEEKSLGKMPHPFGKLFHKKHPKVTCTDVCKPKCEKKCVPKCDKHCDKVCVPKCDKHCEKKCVPKCNKHCDKKCETKCIDIQVPITKKECDTKTKMETKCTPKLDVSCKKVRGKEALSGKGCLHNLVFL